MIFKRFRLCPKKTAARELMPQRGPMAVPQAAPCFLFSSCSMAAVEMTIRIVQAMKR